MEKVRRLSVLSTDDSRISTSGRKKSKVSKSSRELKDLIPKVEQVDEQDTTNYRESITNLFFDSFLDTIIAERAEKHSEDPSFISLSGAMDPSITESRDSVNGSAHLFDSGGSTSGVTLSKGYSSSIRSSLAIPKSTQSATEISSTKDSHISCASSCSCIWKIVFKNGNVYEGQTDGLLMHGKGIFYWTDGSIYTGDFKDGYLWGNGKLVLTDLSTYEGDFCMGFFHGHGTFNVKSTPLLYNGEWKYAQKHGKGWLLYKTNNWYEGDWANNKRHGNGYRQYENGSTYRGEWVQGLINGEGRMFWNNNDCYVGEWEYGYQHGYGEYTWGLITHEQFVFPNYNWYKGNWVNGHRSGAGIMNFGHESGAKLAGTWEMNRKHGPGLMICGNGMILQRNPLFQDDKPAEYKKTTTRDSNLTSVKNSMTNWIEKSASEMYAFRIISEQIKAKDHLEHLSWDSVANITRSEVNIRMNQYIKLLERNTGNAPPLKIPIHNIIHDVDLSYFVQIVQKLPKVISRESDFSTYEINHMINSKNLYIQASHINYISSTNEIFTPTLDASVSQDIMPNVDELKNLIINHLPQLRDIYKTYASFCANEEELTFEPVLVRLFLWQLYRDIGVTDSDGVSIVEIDEMLMKNPKSCLETAHDPWEPIYFWQFLQALVGVASALYVHTNNMMDYTPTSGFMYHMFKLFLDKMLFPNAGKFQGNCLTYLKDLVPIASVYRLYKAVGEPHTTEEFLKNTCLKQGRGPPCYQAINNEDTDECIIQIGTNIVDSNNEILFSERSQTIIKYDEDTRYEKQSLYTFTQLGRKQILKCLAKICPQIMTDSGRTVLHYRLSFIEFYEAILLLSYERAEQDRIRLTEEFKAKDSKPFYREMSRISTHSAKKKNKLRK